MPNRQPPLFFTTARFAISAILFRVRNSFLFAAFLFVAGASILVAPLKPAQPALQAPTQSQSQQIQQPPPGQQQVAPPQGGQQVPPPIPIHTGPVIVLDPAHGGMDSGARGQNGLVEKDLVLLFARTTRVALEREGFRVVMTRNDDSNPSYDDRAALANSYRDAVFVSFHIASTGTLHTARVYSYQFPDAVPGAGSSNAGAPSGVPRPVRPASLVPWEEAQRPYTDASRHLADALQADLALRFPGSPGASSAAAVRGLRSVEAPAIAVEISNVSVSDPNQLIEMAAPVSIAIVHSIVASRTAAGSTAAPGSN
ncbi:MAG: N-acetylmuramoyl-L-alanine amidase [Candidatus Acidiferrales bacterium]|jgi:N-acetylmuramoyl-L-alanine amidase